jgi:hypothetical protein
METWFDYVIGINDHELPTGYHQNELIPNYEYLLQEIGRSSSVRLEIWNAKGGVLKYIDLDVSKPQMDEIPLDNSQPSLYEHFGIKVQWQPLITSTFVYHVLDIHHNSPAEHSGFIEHSDYIISAQDGLLATGGEDLLSRVIESKKNQELVLYVYNHDYDIVRPVTITAREGWGGIGLLGCNVGYGLLHRLPPVSKMEPGSVLFDGLNPVQSNQSAQPPQIRPPPLNQDTPNNPVNQQLRPMVAPRKKKATSANSDMLDYLNQESRDVDTQRKTDNSLPPPPKK